MPLSEALVNAKQRGAAAVIQAPFKPTAGQTSDLITDVSLLEHRSPDRSQAGVRGYEGRKSCSSALEA